MEDLMAELDLNQDGFINFSEYRVIAMTIIEHITGIVNASRPAEASRIIMRLHEIMHQG